MPCNSCFVLCSMNTLFFYCRPLDKYVNDNNIHSVIISKVKLGNYQYGYIVLTEKTISRVWQENEVSVVMYAASLLESEFKNYDKE